MRSYLTLAASLALLAIAWSPLHAQTPLRTVYVSSDVFARAYKDETQIGQWAGTDKHIFIWNASGENDQESGFFNNPTMDATDVTGYHREPRRYVLDTARNIDGVLVRPGDVAAVTSFLSDPTIVFDGRANGVPDGVRIDAVSIDPDSGDLVLSFDRSFAAGALFRKGDLVRWNGSSFQHFFQGDGLPDAADINGAHVLDSGGILMTFESGTTVPGQGGPLYVSDDEVVEYDPDNDWFVTTAVDLNEHPDWVRAGFDALAAIEGGDVLFADRFQE
jgi:hypothetical protein